MSLVTFALLCAATPDLTAATAQHVDLKPRSLRSFELHLPADPWQDLAGLVPVPHAGGKGFLAKPEGVGLAIDTDGDGETDRLVEGKLDSVTKERHAWVRLEGQRADGSELEYAVRLRDVGEGWQWAASGVMQGTIGKTRLRLIDMDGDGAFNGYGTDAMLIGSGSIASHLSRLAYLDGSLQTLDISPDGRTIQLSAFDGPQGTVDARSALVTDGKLLSAVIQSEDGQICFDLARSRGPVAVPVGRYRIQSGQLGLGEARLNVGPGQSKAIEVSAGSSSELAWGGPARAEFAFERTGSQVAFSPDQVWYYGQAGEEYFGWNPIGKSPEFTIKERKLGTVLEKALFPGSC